MTKPPIHIVDTIGKHAAGLMAQEPVSEIQSIKENESRREPACVVPHDLVVSVWHTQLHS